MPIYEYECKKCGKVVDLLQKMGTDKAGVNCPACGEDALAKKLSVTAPAQMASTMKGGCEIGGMGGCDGCCGGCQQ